MVPSDDLEVSAQETLEDKNSKRWIDLIQDAELAYEKFQKTCDDIDKVYADLTEASGGAGADRQMQVFWANQQVITSTIYSRPPVPVVTPRFKDRRPLPRKAGEILERALISDFEQDDLDSTMRMVRDDLANSARGCAWLTVKQEGEGLPYVCAEHVDRKDYLHAPARKWREVDWVARKVYLTRKQMKARFGESSGGSWIQAEFNQIGLGSMSNEDDFKGEKKAEVYELWHKGEGIVVWISKNVDVVLDAQPPLFDVEGFFPCPRPAFGTLQPSTLIPVPDYLQYRDQLHEINDLTARIGRLQEGLVAVGFYPAGAKDTGEAVEAAINAVSAGERGSLLVPVASMAQLGSGSSDLVQWFPTEQVAATIAQCVELRRQLMDDVYQITGLSDIMRGSTEASETATAQNLKAQYGSVRIKQRQEEIVRFARDITRLKAEIMAEQFPLQVLLTMSQVDDLPTQAQVAQQAQQMQQQAMMAQGQGMDPQQAQQMQQQMQGQLQELQNTVTQEAVQELLQSQRTRPFVLEIETDSTIEPNEQAEKQARTEFLTALGGFAQRAMPMVQAFPQSGGLVGAMLEFSANGFRVSRSMAQQIDEFSEKLQALAGQPQQPSAEQQAAQAQSQTEQAKLQLEQQRFQAETQREQARLQLEAKQIEAQTAKTLVETERLRAEPVGGGEDPMEGERREFERQKMAVEREQLVFDLEDKREARADRRREREEEGRLRTADITAAEEEMKVIAEALAQQSQQLSMALETLAQGQQTLAEGQQEMVKALRAPKKFTIGKDGKPDGVALDMNDDVRT